MDTNVQTPVKVTPQSVLEQLLALTTIVEALRARIDKLEESKKSDISEREMTNDDARKIMTGELKDAKHKDAAKALGLSYGQVYSCRLGYTFKNIHKEMKEAGVKNGWIKD